MDNVIRSRIPGTFYRRPSPEEAPYKKTGDKVVTGDIIGLIEVMKTFHEVKSEIDGVIERFEVEDADAVMAGEVLVVLR